MAPKKAVRAKFRKGMVVYDRTRKMFYQLLDRDGRAWIAEDANGTLTYCRRENCRPAREEGDR